MGWDSNNMLSLNNYFNWKLELYNLKRLPRILMTEEKYERIKYLELQIKWVLSSLDSNQLKSIILMSLDIEE